MLSSHLFNMPTTPFADLPIYPDRARAWAASEADGRVRKWASSDGSGAVAKLDMQKYAQAFFWRAASGDKNVGDYKLRFADIINGKLYAIGRGVFEAAAVMQGSRGGVHIPDQDRGGVKDHIAKYYAKMRTAFKDDTIVVPWASKRSADGDIESTIELPLFARGASLKPVDSEKRLAEVTFSTGADVVRRSFFDGPYVERLSLDPKAVRLDRLNAGGPVLDAHMLRSVKDQLGVVVPGSAKIVDGQARATLQFSKRSDVDPIWQDIQDGVLRGVSTGYIIHKFTETTGAKGSMPVRTAVDWEPFEISMHPMPADTAAGVRGSDLETFPCVILARGLDGTETHSESLTESAIADADRDRRLRLARARF